MLHTMLRAGCEVIGVDAGRRTGDILAFVRKAAVYATLLSIDVHYVNLTDGVTPILHKCRSMNFSGVAMLRVALAPVERSADEPSLRSTFFHLVDALRSTPGLPPVAVYAAGSSAFATLTRVWNPFWTPVAAAGLSADALRTARVAAGAVSHKEFFLFGTPISKSPSPFMHNTAFKLLGLGHTYALHDTSDVNSVIACLQTPTTGGGSVTIPHKLAVMPYLAELSPAAEVIGAVNTILVQPDGRLLGYNTDWIGVQNSLLAVRPTGWAQASVVVVGAGGTARAVIFALQRLYCKEIVLYNRTLERAQTLASEFSCRAVDSLDGVDSSTITAIVSTVPATSGFTVPPTLLDARPIVFDVCYIPKWTALLQQARAAKCCTVHGLDMLIHQGIEQARMWCHTDAIPADAITRRVLQQYDPDATPAAETSDASSASAPCASADAAAEAKRLVAAQLQGRRGGELQEGTKAPPTDILNVITAQRRLDVAASKQQRSLEDLKAELAQRQAASTVLPPIDFAARLRASYPTAVLAEIKRASPSKGIIADGINAAEQAARYAAGGAASISVLTEEHWFKGTLADMQGAAEAVHAAAASGASGPRPAILRKDFIIDAYQLYEARLHGADAVLLIVAVLSDDELVRLLAETRALGMEALVEVVTKEELDRAVKAGAVVIGVYVGGVLSSLSHCLSAEPRDTRVAQCAWRVKRACVFWWFSIFSSCCMRTNPAATIGICATSPWTAVVPVGCSKPEVHYMPTSNSVHASTLLVCCLCWDLLGCLFIRLLTCVLAQVWWVPRPRPPLPPPWSRCFWRLVALGAGGTCRATARAAYTACSSARP
eukprot:m.1558704 g.1558704  ORF g.1558704 m.1558704 type:complete len:831 (+) comp25273_c0_seq75:371-2863(+)